MITGRQIREARELLSWDADILAYQARVSTPTIHAAERRGTERMMPFTRAKVVRALESAGVEFTNGDQPGVRLRKG